MRNLCLLCALSLCVTACGRRSLNADHARDALLRTPLDILQKEDVEVVRIHHVGAAEAVVETRLRTAFRMEKVRGEWMVREVRIGNGQWEKAGDLARALEAVKIEETRRALDRIADAIGRYWETHGRLPDFKDFVSLSDLLTPAFLTPLIRVDSWNRPLEADRRGFDSILIRSAGPDGRHGTSDDILRIFTP